MDISSAHIRMTSFTRLWVSENEIENRRGWSSSMDERERPLTFRRAEEDDIGGFDGQTPFVPWITYLHDV